MTISKYPSKLSLPQSNSGFTTVLEYLIVKFPDIKAEIWQQRVTDGKVHWHDGTLITADTAFQAQQRVYYYREVENEPLIPFEEKIIFQDEHILVVYKPHFLAVTPGGSYINECLQNRLRIRTGIESLQALHRLDRATAGLVLFSVNPDTRNLYHQLFHAHKIHKTYQGIASLVDNKNMAGKHIIGENITGKTWEVKTRLEKSTPTFLMRVTEGEPNSHSIIRCLEQSNDKALFELNPVTGKTHQLRLHMKTIGYPLLNDKYYPELQDETADMYTQPLQLLAKELRFIDPVTQLPREFICDKSLTLS